MFSKRVFVSLAFAVAALAAGTSTASAWVEYCDWDPLVVVTTPAGNIVPVYDSVWTATPLNIGLPVETYTTERVYSSTGAPQTKVTMTVRTLPGLLGQFRVHDQVTTGLLGSGTVLAQAYGWSGQALTMSFVLDVA